MRRLLYPIDEVELIRIEQKVHRNISNSDIHLLIHKNDFARLVDQLRDEWEKAEEPQHEIQRLRRELDELYENG